MLGRQLTSTILYYNFAINLFIHVRTSSFLVTYRPITYPSKIFHIACLRLRLLCLCGAVDFMAAVDVCVCCVCVVCVVVCDRFANSRLCVYAFLVCRSHIHTHIGRTLAKRLRDACAPSFRIYGNVWDKLDSNVTTSMPRDCVDAAGSCECLGSTAVVAVSHRM